MKQIIVFETSDSKVHKNEDAAKRHAENRYGDELCRLARILVQVEKYMEMTKWLDINLCQFETLIKLKQDIAIKKQEDDN
jgi:hypothetical protein